MCFYCIFQLFILHYLLLIINCGAYFCSAHFLAGLARFELAHARVKVWCLTAWLQPNVFNLCTHELGYSYLPLRFLENTKVFSAPRIRISVIPFSHNSYPSLASSPYINKMEQVTGIGPVT